MLINKFTEANEGRNGTASELEESDDEDDVLVDALSFYFLRFSRFSIQIQKLITIFIVNLATLAN